MAQEINDNFDVLAGLPIERKYRQITITERDNIPITSRYTGMLCFVNQTKVLYILIGGVENVNWQAINGAGGSAGTSIFFVEGYPFDWKKGRSSLGVINEDNDMEVNDIIMNGFCDYDDGSGLANTLIQLAQYTGGNVVEISSYNVLEYTTF